MAVKTDNRGDYRITLFLVIMLASASVLYAWILPQRWITPDEGAHLMDGRRIVTDGLPPFSLGARQPVYCYILAASQLMFGNTLLAGRIVALVATILTGILLFCIGRRFGDGAGLIATALFLFSPLTLHYATVVQTQPLSILISCLIVMLAISSRRGAFFGAGLLIGFGFLVRESVLAIAPAILIYIFLVSSSMRSALRSAFTLFAGYAVVCALVLTFYSNWWDFSEVWNSRINPLYLPQQIIESVLEPDSGRMAAPARTDSVPSDTRYGARSLATGFRFAALSIVPGFCALASIFGGWWSGRRRKIMALLAGWIAFLAVMYGGWSGDHGFQPGYMREFEPPLAILAAGAIAHALRTLSRPWWYSPLAVAGLLIAVLTRASSFPVWLESVTLAIYAGGGILFVDILHSRDGANRLVLSGGLGFALLLIFFSRRPGGVLHSVQGSGLLLLIGAIIVFLLLLLRVGRIRNPGSPLFLAVTFASIVFATISAIAIGGFNFHGQWPPESGARVAQVLRNKTPETGEVMSGGVIWEYLAGRKSFGNLNHPLIFRAMNKSRYLTKKVLEAYEGRPPDAVVLDGYTDKTFLQNPDIAAAVAREYERYDPEGTKLPVTILLRRNESRAGSGQFDTSR